jgi:toxin ParE1/3/4
MNHSFVVRPDAELDMAAARDWYDGQRDGLGTEFLVELDVVFDRIKSFPESAAVEYRQVRQVPLARFPYVVYYRLAADVIEVVAVLHGSRSPSVWRSRA